MILFLDTQFTDFVQPELISIELVSEDGCWAFYAERTDLNFDLCNVFVKESVLPRLGLPEGVPGGRFDRAGLATALRNR